jgi:NADH-quinone oxidoreductase subunit L
MEHVHESPWVMLVPLLLLAVGAITTGFVFAPYFIGDNAAAFWNGAIFNLPAKDMMAALHHAPDWVPTLAKTVAISGILLAILLYGFLPHVPGRIVAAAPAVHRFLLNKWYFDELYDRIFVQPARRAAVQLWKVGAARIIDGMPNGVASLAAGAARGTVRLQTGKVASYAFAMIIGLVVFVTLFLTGR